MYASAESVTVVGLSHSLDNVSLDHIAFKVSAFVMAACLDLALRGPGGLDVLDYCWRFPVVKTHPYLVLTNRQMMRLNQNLTPH